ncbi:hypothetical protein [Nocardia crassostreae]|uniref:hypothetical protein n=1 Tax=Nocardia crassostreae TaxID=53428 RepID=UPI0012F98666|nr:hypothetical protein [Nocardia crassostreae]
MAIFWGLITVGTYLPALTSRQFYDALLRVKENEQFVILSGLISLVTGAASLAVEHRWEWGLVGVLTAMGWVNVIKGFVRFYELGFARTAVRKTNDHAVVVYVYMALASAFGFYLLYRGFWT